MSNFNWSKNARLSRLKRNGGVFLDGTPAQSPSEKRENSGQVSIKGPAHVAGINRRIRNETRKLEKRIAKALVEGNPIPTTDGLSVDLSLLINKQGGVLAWYQRSQDRKKRSQTRLAKKKKLKKSSKRKR